MTTAVCIFVYAGDSEVLPLCVESVRMSLPAARIHIIDDAAHPVDNVSWMRAASTPRVTYTQSGWQRGGNLRGKACVLGILDEMRATEADTVVKIDCDTLMLSAAWLDNFLATSCGYAGTSRPGTHWSGICYAIRMPLLIRMREAAEHLPIAPQACEDIAIGSLATLVSNPRLTYMIPDQSLSNPSARWAGYNYDASMSPETYARRYDILTFGNAVFHHLPQGARVAPMRAVLDARLRNLYLS